MPVTIDLYEVQFDGGILQRGFWLYVWEITPPKGDVLYYVGRTVDSSSTNAQSPFNRMGQHLGFAKNSNMLRKHLIENGAEPERCTFRLVAVGPIEEESNSDSRHEHDDRRDVLAAMTSKGLAWLDARLEEAFTKHVKVAPTDMAGLDWPKLPAR